MELTGKTLTDFWIWYLLPEQRKTYKTDSLLGKENTIKIRFLAMSFAERYGVFVDFFNSVDIEIGNNYGNVFWVFTENERYFDAEEWNYLDIDNLKGRNEAIERADEIYNAK